MAALVSDSSEGRLNFIDNLRVWAIVLVVLQHIAVIYNTLYLFMIINSAYFMGLLFLLSGYFTPGSLERKRPKDFLKDRLIRLGIPTLAYVLILNPIASWGIQLTQKGSATGYNFALGPMWFAVMLLVFDVGYLIWRQKTRREQKDPPGDTLSKLPFLAILLFMLALAAVTWLLRIVVPYGIARFGFPSLGYLPQYLSFFIIGIIAAQRGWLRLVSGSLGWVGLSLAVVATIIFLPTALSSSGGAFIGFGSWQSATFALWDSIFSVGVSLALIVLFRRFFNKGSKFGRFLSEHSFAVYIIHVPVVAYVALAVSPLQTLPQLKCLIAAAIGLPLCFGVSWLIRRIRFVRN